MYLKKKNGWKSKGFTLIETMVSLSLGVFLYILISGGVIETIKSSNKIYDEMVKTSIVKANIETLKLYLRKGQNIGFKVSNEKLEIKKNLQDKGQVIDEIYKYEKKLYLKYYRKEGSANTVVFEDVDEFSLMEKERLIYMKLKIKGKEYYVCI